MATATATCASVANCPAFTITQATPQTMTTDPSALTNTAVCNSPAILSSSNPTNINQQQGQQGQPQQPTPIRNTYEEFVQQYKQTNGFARGGAVQNYACGGSVATNPTTNPYGITPGSVCFMQTDNPTALTPLIKCCNPFLAKACMGLQYAGMLPYVGSFINAFTGATSVQTCTKNSHVGPDSIICKYGVAAYNGGTGYCGYKNFSDTPYYGTQTPTQYIDIANICPQRLMCGGGCALNNYRSSFLCLYPEYTNGNITGWSPTAICGETAQTFMPTAQCGLGNFGCSGANGSQLYYCLYPEYNKYSCILGLDKSTAPGSWIPPWEGGNMYCPWGNTLCGSPKYTPGTYNNYPQLGTTWWQAPASQQTITQPPPASCPAFTTSPGTTPTGGPAPVVNPVQPGTTSTGTGTTPMPTCTTPTTGGTTLPGGGVCCAYLPPTTTPPGTAPGTTGTGTTTTPPPTTTPPGGTTTPPATCTGNVAGAPTQVGVPVTTPGANTQILQTMQQNAASPQLPQGTSLQPTLLQNSSCLELNPNNYQVNTPQVTPTTVGGAAVVCPVTGLTAHGYTAAQTCPAFTIHPAQGQVDPCALVSNQLQKLTCFQNGTPGWAQPAINAANSVMAARGLGSSTIMGGAFVNAIESAALPVAQANAQYFANLDMANLTNQQQAIITGAQLTAQALLSNTAAQNAALQFNAQSANQTEQFMANLNSQIQLTNAAQINAMQQFNAGQLNSMAEFNANMANNVQQFNAQNRLAIDQSNVTWRRNINTLNTAAINAANQVNTQNLFNLTSTAQNDLWQQLQDQASWANTDAQNALTRAQNMAIAALGVQTAFNLQNSAQQAALFQLLGSFGVNVGSNLLNNVTNSLFSSTSNNTATQIAASCCLVNNCPSIQNVLNG